MTAPEEQLFDQDEDSEAEGLPTKEFKLGVTSVFQVLTMQNGLLPPLPPLMLPPAMDHAVIDFEKCRERLGEFFQKQRDKSNKVQAMYWPLTEPLWQDTEFDQLCIAQSWHCQEKKLYSIKVAGIQKSFAMHYFSIILSILACW